MYEGERKAKKQRRSMSFRLASGMGWGWVGNIPNMYKEYFVDDTIYVFLCL